MKKYFAPIVLAFALFSCAGESEEITTEESIDNLEEIVVVSPFTEFKIYVAGLTAELPNIDSLFAKYDALKEGFSQEEKDSAYFIANDFMNRFEVSESEQEDYSEKAIKNLNKKYNKAGFTVGNEEGYYFLWVDIKFLEKKFKKDLSAELDDYLDVLKKVDGQITSDAGLIISWAELAEMILVCEDFMVENNDSKYFDEVMGLYLTRMRFFMWGLDNTPIIDWNSVEGESKYLDIEVESEYKRLMQDDKHGTGSIINDHFNFLSARDFDFSYEDQVDLTEAVAKQKLGLK